LRARIAPRRTDRFVEETASRGQARRVIMSNLASRNKLNDPAWTFLRFEGD
jgi:hypothetical protein